MQDITNRVRNNQLSHSEVPLRLVRGLTVAAVSLPILLSGCSTAKGNARAAQHASDQVRMIAVQREARVQEKQAEAAQNTALVEALARVAEANPEQASSVAVALAVIGVRGADNTGSDAPTVTLQKEQNVGLEYVKALAPTVGNLVSGLGVAVINAGVQKNASDNNRAILLGDQAADRGIVEAVAGVGIAAAESSGLMVSGDNYTLSDSASISQDQVSTVATTTTTTETTTETNTSSEIADSYNTETNTTSQAETNTTNQTETNTTNQTETNTENTDSYNADSFNDMSDNTDNSYVTYGNEQMTLAQLVSFLQESGQPYSFSIGDDIYTDDVAEEEEEGLTCIPTFEGYVCTGG